MNKKSINNLIILSVLFFSLSFFSINLSGQDFGIGGDSEINRCETKTYTITIQNDSGNPLTNIVILAKLQNLTGFSYVNGTSVITATGLSCGSNEPVADGGYSGDCSPAPSTPYLTWDIDSLCGGAYTLADGDTLTVDFDLKTDCTAVSASLNTFIDYDISGTPMCDDTGVLNIQVNPGAVTIKKTPNVTPQYLGDTVTWTLQIENTGFGVIENVVVTDILDTGLQYTSSTQSGVNAGQTTTWTSSEFPALASMDPGDILTMDITAEVISCINLNNTAHVRFGCDSSNVCYNTEDNPGSEARASIQRIVRTPVLEFTPPDITFDYCEDTQTNINFTITNNGDGIAYDVYTIVDFGNFTVSNVSSGATYDNSTNRFHLDNPLAASGGTYDLSFDLTYNGNWCDGSFPDGDIIWQKEYKDECDQLFYPPVELSTMNPPTNVSSLSVDKSGAGSVIQIGDSVTYNITSSYSGSLSCGSGPGSTGDVTVVDTIPAGFTVTDAGGGIWDNTAGPTGNGSTGGTITWTYSPPASLNTSIILQSPDTSQCETYCNTTFTNDITASNTDCCGCSLSASASETTAIECAEGVTSDKTSSSPTERCDDTTYTNTYVFSGGSAVVLSDLSFEEHAENDQLYVATSLSVNLSGSGDITGCVGITDNTASGGSLLLDFSGCAATSLAGQTLTITYDLTATENTVAACTNGAFYSWSSLDMGPVGSQCLGDGIIHETTEVNISVPDMSLSITGLGQIVNSCETKEITMVLTQTSSNSNPKDVKLVLSGLNYYIVDVANPGAITCSGVAPVSCIPIIDGNGDYVWTFNDAFTGNGQAATIVMNVQKRCSGGGELNGTAYWDDLCSDDATPDEQCNTTATEAPALLLVADLLIEKNPETYYADTKQVQWEIYITNRGTGTAYNVWIDDVLGSGLVYEHGVNPIVVDDMTGVTINDSLDHNGGAINGASIEIASMEAGERRQITFIAQQIACTDLTNDVTSSWGCIAPPDCQTPVTDSSVVTIPAPNLINTNIITPTDGVDACESPQGFITLRNAGQITCYNLQVTETLPANLTYVSGTTRWRLNGGGWNGPNVSYDPIISGGGLVLNWTQAEISGLATADSGDTIEIEFEMTTDCPFDGGDITCQTQYENPCATVFNTAVSTFTASFNEPDIRVTKTRANDPIDCGETVTWDITVENRSGYTLPIIWVEDTMDAAYTYDSSTGDPPYTDDNGTNAGQVITWELRNVPHGTTVNLTLTATEDGSCNPNIDNVVRAYWGCGAADGDSATKPGVDPPDNSLCLTSDETRRTRRETREPAMGYLNIAMSPSTIDTCDDSTDITVILENTGPTDARNVDLVLTLPAGLTYNAGTSQSGIGTDQVSAIAALSGIGNPAITGGGTILTWYDVGSMATNLATTIQADGGNDTLALRFSVQSACYITDNLDFDLYYYDCCEDTQYSTDSQNQLTASFPSLTITKTPVSSQVDCASSQSWTITVTNNGTANAEIVRIEDTPGDWIDINIGASTPGLTDMGGGVYGWEFNNLGIGASRSFTIVGNLNPDGFPNQNDCTDTPRENNVQAIWACGTTGDAIDNDPTTTSNYSCTDSTPVSATTTILEMPNLVVTSISPSINCTSDGTFTGSVIVRVTNNGDGNSTANFTVQVTDGQGWTGTGIHSGTIAAGSFADVSISTVWTPACQPCTTFNFNATVDLNNDVCECNENDNTSSVATAYNIELPDIEVTGDTLTTTCTSDGAISVSGNVNLTNNGCDGTLTSDIPMRFTLYDNTGCSGNQVAQWTETLSSVNLASGGGTQTFTITSENITTSLVSNSTSCQYSIRVEADYNDSICECDGTNNVYCADNKNVDIPNIEVSADTLGVNCTADGEISVSGNVTIVNSGCGSNMTSDIPVRFTLFDNADCTGNSLGTWTETLSSANISANGGTQTFTITPQSMTTNLVTNSNACLVSIRIEADYTNTICESDGTDNTYCASNIPVDIPDVQIQSDSLTADCSSLGEVTVSGDLVLVNNGCGSNMNSNVPVRFTLYDNINCSGDQVAQWTETLSSINIAAGGGTQTVSITPNTITFDPATDSANCQFSIRMEADYSGTAICESDGTNNELCSNKIVNIPDLIINSVATTVTCLSDGNLTGTTVSVTNSGCGDATSIIVRLTSDCGLTFADQTIDLAAGETKDVFFAFEQKITGCVCGFTATIDPDNLICESDDSNNSMTSTAEMSIPDLEVLGDNIIIDCADDGKIKISGSVNILNSGCGSAFNNSVPVRFSLYSGRNGTGKKILEWTENINGGSINPGSSSNYNFSDQIFDFDIVNNSDNGWLSVGIELDYNNSICEWDGTNNNYLIDKKTEYTDFVINDIEYVCNPDNSVSLKVTVSNNGTQNASGVYVSIINGENTTNQIVDLPAGSTKTYTYDTEIYKTTIDMTVSVIIDKANDFCEVNGDNNKKDIHVYCVPPGTPKLELIKTCPKADIPGGIFKFEIRIRNTGDGDATDVFIEDILPEKFKYVTGTTLINGVKAKDPIGTTILKWELGELKKGEEILIQYNAITDADIKEGRYCNLAYAFGRTLDNKEIASEKVDCCTIVTRNKEGCCLRIETDGRGFYRIPEMPVAFFKPYFYTEDAMYLSYSSLQFYKNTGKEKGVNDDKIDFIRERLKNYAMSSIEEFYLNSNMGIINEDKSLEYSYGGAYPITKENGWKPEGADKTMTLSQVAFEMLALNEAVNLNDNKITSKKLKNILEQKIGFIQKLEIDRKKNIAYPHSWHIKDDKLDRGDKKANLFDKTSLYFSVNTLIENGYSGLKETSDYLGKDIKKTIKKDENKYKGREELFYILGLSKAGKTRLTKKRMKRFNKLVEDKKMKVDSLYVSALAMYSNLKFEGNRAGEFYSDINEKYYNKNLGIYSETLPDLTYQIDQKQLASLILSMGKLQGEQQRKLSSDIYRMIDETGLFLNKRHSRASFVPVNLIKNSSFMDQNVPIISTLKLNKNTAPVFSRNVRIYPSVTNRIEESVVFPNYSKVFSPSYENDSAKILAYSYSLQHIGNKIRANRKRVVSERGRTLENVGQKYLEFVLDSKGGYFYENKLIVPFNKISVKGKVTEKHSVEPLSLTTDYNTEAFANLFVAENIYMTNKGKKAGIMSDAVIIQKKIIKEFVKIGFIPEKFKLFIDKDRNVKIIPSKEKADKITIVKLLSGFDVSVIGKFIEKGKSKKLDSDDLLFLSLFPKYKMSFEKELEEMSTAFARDITQKSASVIANRILGKEEGKYISDIKKFWEKDVQLPVGRVERIKATGGSRAIYDIQKYLLFLSALKKDEGFIFNRSLDYFSYLLEGEWGIIKGGRILTAPPKEIVLIKERPRNYPEPGDLFTKQVRIYNSCLEPYQGSKYFENLFIWTDFTTPLLYYGTEIKDDLTHLNGFKWKFKGMSEGGHLSFMYQALIPSNFTGNNIKWHTFVSGMDKSEEIFYGDHLDKCEDDHQGDGIYIRPLTEIKGIVYEDTNVNGRRDVGEIGVTGIIIKDSLGRSFVTDENGEFRVKTGTEKLIVQVDMQSLSADLTMTTRPTELVNSAFEHNIAFGIVTCINVKGFVYNDLNGNGVFDKEEPKIGGIFIKTRKKEIITDKDGNFEIYNLPKAWKSELKVQKKQPFRDIKGKGLKIFLYE